MVKNKILYIIILVLFIIILLQRCGGNKISSISTISIKHDTTYLFKDSIIRKTNLKLVKGDPIPYEKWDTIYYPDTNYEKLRTQYLNNTRELLSKNIYTDSVAFDSSNYVKINDTVQLNKIIGRDVFFHLTDKTITTTITKTIIPPSKSQVYFGIGLLGNKIEPIKGAEINLSLKNKKDQIYEIGTQFINNELVYKIGTKWKIKL